MYQFAIVALLGLGTLKVVDLLEDLVPALSRISALLRLGIGIVAAVAIDYSVFNGFGVGVREHWLGTATTGVVIGSMATVWSAALGWLGGAESGSGETSQHGRPRMAA